MNNDLNIQKEIIALIPEIRKYFSFNCLKAVGEPKIIKRQWLSIIKQLTKEKYKLSNKHHRIYKDDGKVIRTRITMSNKVKCNIRHMCCHIMCCHIM